jgi:hypothetical protein
VARSGKLAHVSHPAAAPAPRRRRRGRDLLCALCLALLPFLLFWRVTLGHGVFAHGDLFTYNYPILRVVAEQWKEGRVPLWNPYIFGGTPLLAAIQGGVFYAPNVLLLLEPLWLWYGYSILLQYSLSGVFSFLYLRRLDLSRAAGVRQPLLRARRLLHGHLGHGAADIRCRSPRGRWRRDDRRHLAPALSRSATQWRAIPGSSLLAS